jgi:hypothetical protein
MGKCKFAATGSEDGKVQNKNLKFDESGTGVKKGNWDKNWVKIKIKLRGKEEGENMTNSRLFFFYLFPTGHYFRVVRP